MIRWLFVFTACLGSLAAEVKILAISGSTREGSYNKKLVQEAAQKAEEMGASVTVIDLKDYPLPFYDEDLEHAEGMPLSAKKFRQLLIESDGVIIASPEYNHSVSGVLKNILDWASRNEQGRFSRDAFEGKKFALMSASPGKKGGEKGLIHLRDILEELHAVVVPTQVCIGRVHEVLATENGLKDPSILNLLTQEISEIIKERFMKTVYSSLSEVAAPYKGILLDAYGVFWGGNTHGALTGAKEEMARLMKEGKIVGVLSNSSQLSESEREKLARHGFFEGEHYHFYVTSGDSAKALFSQGTLPFPAPQKRFWVFGAGHPKFSSYSKLFEGSGYEETKVLEEADFIYIAVPHLNGEDQTDPDVFRPLVEMLRSSRNLPMICANGDMFAHEGEPPRLVVRQGSIAKFYEECGGTVYYMGKPDSFAYEEAMRQFQVFGIADRTDVLMVGDTPEIDIRGAVRFGMPSALVTKTGVMGERNTPFDMLPPSDQPRYFIERLGR